MMSDLQWFARDIGREIANYCNQNNINFFYQIIIQIIALFLLGLMVMIYEECCKKKDIKFKTNNNNNKRNRR